MASENHFSWRRAALAAAVCVLLVVPGAFAQLGRFSGVVLDDRSQPLRGATIRAESTNGTPPSATSTSTSDERGQFYFIGLRSGQWKFTIETPGFLPTEFTVPIKTGAGTGRPVGIKLQRDAALVLNGPLAGVDARMLRADLAAADEAFAKGDFDSAIINYRAVLLRAPALTLANLQIGNAYRQKKDYVKAAEAFQSVLKAEPTNAVALYDLGEVRREEGQVDQAREFYEKAAASAPTWTKPLLRLGVIANEKGDQVTAVAQLKKVLSADPGSPEAAAAEALLQKISR
jgi:tetratricopeptide (TPR) repeat protein